MTARLTENETLGRFEMSESGQTVFADYRIAGGQLFIDHVESPVALRGSGAAGRLMALVADHARRSDLRIVPICGYAAAWLKRNPAQPVRPR
jgi:predicted GNAT family acetyltransferase